jgi:hypothetical protein
MRLKIKKAVPYSFVLEEMESLGVTSIMTRPMFGCLAVYTGEKIVLILREKEDYQQDNGVWLATIQDHHASLKKDFPSMRSISVFGPGVTGWQVLPADSPDFEEAVLKACSFIRREDPRIGKVPKPKRKPKLKRKPKRK